MNKNFTIEKGIEIIVGDEWYDLHNSYDHKGYEINYEQKKLNLKFEPNKEWGKGLKSLNIKFSGVQTFETLIPSNEVNLDVDEIGYKTKNDKEYAWLEDEKNCTPEHHMIFRFTDESYIRVYADSAMVEII